MEFTIRGNPATKKNSMQIRRNRHTGRQWIAQSDRYKAYEEDALRQLDAIFGRSWHPIDTPIELRCHFYRRTRHRVDLTNLLAAVCDVLVTAGVIADDNASIVCSHDGSRVYYDKENPRTVVWILPFEEEE